MRHSRIAPVAVITVALALNACGDSEKVAEDSARFATDTVPATATTVPAGPIPSVTAADGDLMRDALDFRLTDENFAAFAKASEALSFLRSRDMNVRSMLEQAGTTADTTTGSLLERLEGHPQVSQAITNAGMTVRDYYVMAIALANAQRHAGNPEAAPPTPVGQANAAWVAKNQGQLARLQTWGAAVAQ